MLSRILLICHGPQGKACCQFTILEGDHTLCRFSLHGLPPCLAIVGSGRRWHSAPTDGTLRLEPLDPHDLWAVLCSPTGEVLAWGSTAGRWHEDMGMALCAQFAPTPATTNVAPRANHIEPPAVQHAETAQADAQRTETEDAAAVIQTPTQSSESAATDTEQSDQTVVTTHDTTERTETTQTAEEDATQSPAEQSTPANALTGGVGGDFGATDPAARPLPAQYAPYFAANPPCRTLQAALPDSRFVEVHDADVDYVLGVLYDSDGHPTHLCYGVAGRRDRPLHEGEWLPILGDEGYWLIYHPLSEDAT